MNTSQYRLCALILVLSCAWGSPREAFAEPALPAGIGLEGAPIVVDVRGASLQFDASLSEQHRRVSTEALDRSLDAVPRITGLPAFTTPIEAHVLGSDARFRQALEERGGVRVDLVAEEIGGYAIERNGVMLLFFTPEGMDMPGVAALAFAHELAHLVVREASQRRPVPQWLNEGYAQWASYQVLREIQPDAADIYEAVDRAVVSSAMNSGAGLIPWASLVTRTRFSRAGTEGQVDLAYGQSTLFVDWLAHRSGRESLVSFLQALGEGTSATQSFSRAFGQFAPMDADFRASLDALAVTVPRGLVRVTGDPQPGLASIVAIVGGDPGETDQVEIRRGDELVRALELTLTPGGSGFVRVEPGAGSIPEVRLRSGSLGELVIRTDQQAVPALPREVSTPISLFWPRAA